MVFNANTTIGNATTDTLTTTARLASDLDPSTDNARDLGTSSLAYKAMYSYDFFASAGAVGTPSIAASTDTDTGLFWSAANVLNIAAGGTEIAEFDGTSVDFTVDVITSAAFKPAAGAVGTPSIAASTDTDTGLFWSAANVLNITAGGSEIAEFDGTSVDFTVDVNTSGNVHITRASSGATANAAADDLIVEGSGDTGISILTTGVGYIMWGDGGGGAANQGQILYNHTGDAFNFITGGTTRIVLDGDFYTNTDQAVSLGTSSKRWGVIYTAPLSTDPLATAADGQVIAGTSDARLKTIIRPYDKGLAAVRLLNPVYWKWNKKSNMYDGGKIHSGFEAQKVEKILPETVGKLDQLGLKDCRTFADQNVVPALVLAVQELEDQLEEMRQYLKAA